jgi:hypothetical protein
MTKRLSRPAIGVMRSAAMPISVSVIVKIA